MTSMLFDAKFTEPSHIRTCTPPVCLLLTADAMRLGGYIHPRLLGGMDVLTNVD